MSCIFLPTGKLYYKKETKRLNIFLQGMWEICFTEFYSRIANDVDVPFEDIQKYLLGTSGFTKGMQTDINHYVTGDRLNNGSLRQKLDPIAKNIFCRQNPLKLVFEDIFTFDAQNLIVGSLFRELDIEKKDLASELIEKAPRSGLGLDIQKTLEAL